MKCIIILSCEGRDDSGFKFCSGVENTVLDLDGLEVTENYLDLIKYLDTTPEIFDRPCCKSHVISNAIYKMYELGYLDEELYARISDFYKFHGRCGLVLRALPK
jgi:hypothetical protein